MSAWLCTDHHVSAIVNIPQHFDRDQTALELFANKFRQEYPDLQLETNDTIVCFWGLHRENLKSLDARYPKDDGSKNSPADWFDGELATGFKYRSNARFPDQATAFKNIGCLDYQSCEHSGWDKSTARALLDHLEYILATSLPGYNAAPWGYDENAAQNQATPTSLEAKRTP